MFEGWSRGDVIEKMVKDRRSADFYESKRMDVSAGHGDTGDMAGTLGTPGGRGRDTGGWWLFGDLPWATPALSPSFEGCHFLSDLHDTATLFLSLPPCSCHPLSPLLSLSLSPAPLVPSVSLSCPLCPLRCPLTCPSAVPPGAHLSPQVSPELSLCPPGAHLSQCRFHGPG